MFDIPNINIPIYILLFVFAAFLIIYVFSSLFNIYHLLRYGISGFGLYLIVTIFTGGTILLVAGSAMMLTQYDWSVPISLNSAAQFYNEDLFQAL